MNNKKIILGLTLAFITFQSALGQKDYSISRQYEKEVRNTLSDEKLKEAFKVIDSIDPQTIEDQVLLTEIPAPPFQETRRAKKFKEMLEAAGVDEAWIDEEGNVLAIKKGTEGNRKITLDAHLDTVFPLETDVKVRRSGDTLRAPGIGDDTRGLAMVLAVLKAMNTAEIETKADVYFIGTVGEEGLGDLRGVKHLFREEAPVKFDSWISIDGGSAGRVNTGALGSKRYKAVFEGRGGHSWGAFGLANPHHALGKAIDYFVKAASEYTSEGPKTSFNVGRIGGGTSVNSIPFESWFEVDMRSLDPYRLLVIDSLFKASVNQAVEDYNNSDIDDKVSVRFEKIGDRPSGRLSSDLPLIQRTLAATKELGIKPRLTTGSTNSNIPISMGIPSVTIGRGGRGGKAHSLDEWWANIAGARAIKLALLVTVLEAELAD